MKKKDIFSFLRLLSAKQLAIELLFCQVPYKNSIEYFVKLKMQVFSFSLLVSKWLIMSSKI